jgi:hypothetical protein
MKITNSNTIYGNDSLFGSALAFSSLENLASRVFKSLTVFQSPALMQILHDILKKCCCHFFILLLSYVSVFGKIKNGYEKGIAATRHSVVYLQNQLWENDDLSSVHRRKLQSSLDLLLNHVSFFELTENLLSEFKIIAPDVFTEIDTITDRLGRPVDVYVKFVAREATEVKAWGSTYANQLEDDKDAYFSEYGPFTVSVKVWTVQKALEVLSHEFGHVKYQVPNLASYMKFHKAHYGNIQVRTFIGHNPKDPSGKCANEFGATFRKRYINFVKSGNEKIQNPEIILARIRKILTNKYYSVSKKARQNGIM